MSKQQLIVYLEGLGGKHNTLETWHQLGKRFGLTKDAAEHAWRKHKRKDKSSRPALINPTLIEAQAYVADLEDTIIKYEEDRKGNKAYVDYTGSEEIKTEADLIRVCKIDTNRWQIARLMQNAWGKPGDQRFQVKATLEPVEAIKTFQQNFTEFLNGYITTHSVVKSSLYNSKNSRSCLIFNKQDSHLNKYDVNGDNDITDRFKVIEEKTEKILQKASLTSYLDKIIYIVGSDEFNSEWTSCTVKGTPQQNILPYHVAFQAICQHETAVINQLLKYASQVEVIYVPGNHDEYVGWHMVSWLKAYYKEQANLNIDITPNYTKYIRYSNTALMFNHGCSMKPEKLAQNFPIEFKDQWSCCSNYYIFTGDKHTELSRSIGGIKFYQIPALSTSKSKWDEINGYTTNKAEMTAFLIDEFNGMTDIYKELVR